MIRVAVVDDEALVRSGFEMMLAAAEGIEVVASVDGMRAIDALQSTRPDVVLLDIRMPGVNGLDILDILRTWPDPPTAAILTTFDTDAYIMQALGKGAAGFLVKDTDPEELPGLIRSLASGAIVLSPQVSRIVVSGYIASDRSPRSVKLDELTAREQQVLTRLTMGESNTEIGRALHLSVGTVKDHVSAILLKLNVSTRLQAAVIAERASNHPRLEELP